MESKKSDPFAKYRSEPSEKQPPASDQSSSEYLYITNELQGINKRGTNVRAYARDCIERGLLTVEHLKLLATEQANNPIGSLAQEALSKLENRRKDLEF